VVNLRRIAMKKQKTYTPAEAAVKTGFSVETIRRWIRQGKIGKKIGGRMHISAADIAKVAKVK
jgi:excisionase family DNA binding protein